MARRRRSIIRFPGMLRPNIGVVVFAFIAVYIMFNVYSYYTAVRVVSYEVEQGIIEVNTSYTGLILRSETVVNAQQSGKLDYYLRDNTKASFDTLVCSVDENGNVSSKLNEAADSSAVLTKENLDAIQDSIRDYAYTYSDSNFYATYNFKSDIRGKLMEAMNLSALESLEDYTDFAKDSQSFHLYRAEVPGVVAYYTDGFEQITLDSIKPKFFDKSTYQKVSQKTNGEVESGQAVYKLITDENWQIVVQADEAMIDTLKDTEVVEIRFKEDNATSWANCEIRQIGSEKYLVLSLRTSMIRYAYERYIDIQILLDQQSGLKIPNSSITTKSFEVVPKEYLTYGNADSNKQGLLVEHLGKGGTYEDAEFVPVTIFFQTEDEIFLSQDDIKKGDRIVMTGSTDRYEVSDRAKLKGVYNINKGYAVFKQIEELYHNDDYTIVKAGTSYGITLYDHIALNGNEVSEDQIIGR